MSRRPRLASAAARRSLFAAVLIGVAAPVAAQQVRFDGRPQDDVERRLVALLDRGGYSLFTGDTTLTRDDRVPGDLIVLNGDVRIAAPVDGSVFVVDGVLFLRPGARVAGEIAVLGGGYYSSSRADVVGDVTYRPTEPIRAMPDDGGWLIFRETEQLPVFEPDGIYGIQLPVYQRVDALVLGAGATVRATGLAWRPDLYGAVRFKTGPGEFEGTIRQFWHPSDRFKFGLAASRATRTNEEWIRREWVNSLFLFLAGDDFRDYHGSDRIGLYAELETRNRWRFTLGGRWEEARSLEARDVFSIFSADADRPNPAIDEGDTWSLLGAAEWERHGRRSRTAFRLGLEGASESVTGDHSFLLGDAQFAARFPAFGPTGLELFAIGRGDLAGTLPGQRRSSLGGIGTIPTVPILALRGERLAFGEVAYTVPLITVGRLGEVGALARGSLGSAWSSGESPRFEESIAVAMRALALEMGLAYGSTAVPGDTDWVFYLDVRFPRGPHVPQPRPQRFP